MTAGNAAADVAEATHMAAAESTAHVAATESAAHVAASKAAAHMAAAHVTTTTHVTAATSAARERTGDRKCEGCCQNCYECEFLAHDIHPPVRGCRPVSQLSARVSNGIGHHMLLTAGMYAARGTHACYFRISNVSGLSR
jgi:hypothetical protein